MKAKKMITTPLLYIILSGILFTVSCKKNSPGSATGTGGTNPGNGTGGTVVKYTPVAFAGKDTTIYAPFTSFYLNSSGTTDRDKNIVLYKWRLLSGPSTVTITNPERSETNAKGLIYLGIFSFELAVTDADNQTSRDTVNVTVGDPNCTGVLQEIVISNISWNFSWIMDYDFRITDLLPPHSKIKNISIKRDNSTIWEPVIELNISAPDYRFHTWEYGNGIIAIYPHEINMTNDTPDIKIEYCN